MDEDNASRGLQLRRVLKGGCALLLVAALVLAWHGSGSYQPLRSGSSASFGDAVLHTVEHRDEHRLPFRPDTPHVVAVSVANGGRWGVTIDSVVIDDPDWQGVIRLVAAAAIDHVHLPQSPVRLPYRLPAGQELGLRLTYRVGTCGNAPGVLETRSSIRLRWHALGRSHITDVAEPPLTAATPMLLPATYRSVCAG